MSLFDLVFQGKTYTVPKQSISDLLEHRKLFGPTCYTVESSVPVPVFASFVRWLKTRTKISVTKENAAFLSFLASEFFLLDLRVECDTFQLKSEPERVEKLKGAFRQTDNGRSKAIEISITEPNSLDGIISYLTKQHGGNVHKKKIVVITSRSGRSCLQTHPADVVLFAVRRQNREKYWSEDFPGQWVCWDFREMRVRPTHCTVSAFGLNSWVLEGSVDGESRMELDRQTGHDNFRYGDKSSFAV
jgi:hypothetical protein